MGGGCVGTHPRGGECRWPRPPGSIPGLLGGCRWHLGGPFSGLSLCHDSRKAPEKKSEEARIKLSVTVPRVFWERRSTEELGWHLVASQLNAKVTPTPSPPRESCEKEET